MRDYSYSKGGVSFEDSSAPVREASILAFLPDAALVPLATETGARSQPVVSVGDSVAEGGLLARGRNGSANIHAPIPGVIVRTVEWEPEPGMKRDAFVVRLEGAFTTLGKAASERPWAGVDAAEIRALLDEYGVTEMDGQGRPLTGVLRPAAALAGPSAQPPVLVVRCVFDDPWLAADRCLCAERTDAVAAGAIIAARAAGAKAVILAVSSNERGLGGALLKAAAACGGIAGIAVSLAFTGSRYPQHSAWELSAVLRRYTKDAGLEASGLVFIGPATAAAAYDAVVRRTPPLARYVAVGGSAVRAPAVLRARVGARIGSLFAECGGLITGRNGPVLVIGSPLMGRAVSSLDEPILRTTRSVFARKRTVHEAALAGSRLLRRMAGVLAAPPCMGCGECRASCPAGLDPEAIFKGLTAGARASGPTDGGTPPDGCFGCGCCEAVCPSRLPLCSAMNRRPQPEASK